MPRRRFLPPRRLPPPHSYNPDVALAGSDIKDSGVTTGAALADLFRSQFGKMPHVTCDKG